MSYSVPEDRKRFLSLAQRQLHSQSKRQLLEDGLSNRCCVCFEEDEPSTFPWHNSREWTQWNNSRSQGCLVMQAHQAEIGLRFGGTPFGTSCFRLGAQFQNVVRRPQLDKVSHDSWWCLFLSPRPSSDCYPKPIKDTCCLRWDYCFSKPSSGNKDSQLPLGDAFWQHNQEAQSTTWLGRLSST